MKRLKILLIVLVWLAAGAVAMYTAQPARPIDPPYPGTPVMLPTKACDSHRCTPYPGTPIPAWRH